MSASKINECATQLKRHLLALLSILFGCFSSYAAAVSPDSGANGTDSLFEKPYVDIDEWRDKPVRHRYVHGGFKDTDTRFSFYFPSKEKYQGRFFQYITPVPDSENLSQHGEGEEDKISFAIASGAYFIETNGGGKSALGMPGSGVDPTIGAYRANAAAAEYSRVIAQKFYGDKRPYGYAFGGSGGAFRTIGGAENTVDVWDGVVPYVVGSPMAIPNVFSARMHAMRVLHDKFPQIIDALEPGGSGDMYAGLSDEERDTLREVTRMGFPPKSWFGYETMGVHAFSVLYPAIVKADPSYFSDFWSKPGYLGANPPASLLKARLQYQSAIKQIITAEDAEARGLNIHRMPGQSKGTADKAWQSLQDKSAKVPVAFQLAGTPPDVNFLGGDLIVKTGAAAGKSVELRRIDGDVVVLGVADAQVLQAIKPGDAVQVDNSNFLAAQTYYRHQVPGRDYYVWDQFRDADGKPIYPQRPYLLGPIFTANAAGTVPNGKFHGKMIMLESLWDREAFPWQADWYRSKVIANLGDKTDANFRLWFIDHALHGDFTRQEDPTHTISYLGALQQALRDLSAWVEKGVAPPATTNYKIVDGQVVVPAAANERKGIQPVITLQANGGARADVKAGEPVEFSAVIDVPANTGSVVSAEWDFAGAGDFAVKENLGDKRTSSNHLVIKHAFVFSKPGTYFPTLRAAAQRQDDEHTPFARVQNLERVRVVVK
ncbi:MAG TPA: hypothetical protein VFM32_04210 [Spongiibacteraceae bacterium]|nr:hypothetical protein [Spongiibacteraceae bacterium]